MANVDGTVQKPMEFPLPEFYFSVEVPDVGTFICKEVSGIDEGFNEIDYRQGNQPVLTQVRMPGLHKVRNVDMKGVTFRNNGKDASDLLKNLNPEFFEPRPVVVALRDGDGNMIRRWELTNVRPTRIILTELQNDGGGVSFEAISFAHEGITAK